MAVRTFATLIGSARTLLQDKVVVPGGTYRYSDAEMFEAINDAMTEARAKRPDLFLGFGLRNGMPFYTADDDMDTIFPLDPIVYPAFVYYLVGRCELREDTFSDDSRAVQMMNKFVSQLMAVVS